MRCEYWCAEHETWTLSRVDWTPEQIAEINGAVGWEMYREAE